MPHPFLAMSGWRDTFSPLNVTTNSEKFAGGHNVGTFGRHWLAEYLGCSPSILDDLGQIKVLLRNAAEAAGARVVGEVFQRFAPQGVSGVVVIEESHLSIHTWPERGYAAVDFYTCGDCAPEKAHESLRASLQAERSELLIVHRGRIEDEHVLGVHEHRASESCRSVS